MATWFAFKGGYGTVELAGLQEKNAVAFGFHGYATQAEAETPAHRNSVNALQAAWLNLVETDYKTAVATGQQPGGPNSNLSNPSSYTGVLATGAQTAGKGLLGSLDPNWFLRVGEVLLGLILIAVGVAKLTNAVPAATKIASKIK